MLTNEHSIVVYKGGRAVPDRLTQRHHGHYPALAEKMLAVYRSGAGAMRRDLHSSVEGVFAQEEDCPARRIHAFCKLLDDASVYDTDRSAKAEKLRMHVFAEAAKSHPLVERPDRLFETSESRVKAQIAQGLGRPWADIEAELYADVMEFHRLKAFPGYASAKDLLSRYNVAQAQTCLYRAERMVITASADFKTILRYVKLFGLLHDISRRGPSAYRIDLSGPVSALRHTQRYGVAFAKLLPALLLCKGWTMEAFVRTPWDRMARFSLSSREGLTGHMPPPEEFDSTVEEKFARKFGSERDGWRLMREARILRQGQTVFVPDFLFLHEDGTEVLFEIVGFWTPEYLERKRETLRRFRNHAILLAVPEKSLREDATIPDDVIPYKTALQLAPILAALARMRGRSARPIAPETTSAGRP
ncbi:MAG: DUF790 family protein [Planctomycetota bacterium]